MLLTVSCTVLLFLSGFAALIYQTLWLRLLGLVFGVTVYAASTVLAAFMAGLAIGSLAAGRLSDRVRAPLRWFGGAELLIAAFALSTPAALDALETIYRNLHTAVGDRRGLLTVARFACSCAILLVPTTLMGATLPLALRAVVRQAADVGRQSALLYAANTAGALIGALATGYYFVSGIGIDGSFRVAAVCNVVAGVGALLVGTVALPAKTHLPGASRARVERPLSRVARLAVLGMFGLSGFVALALEIVWFRALLLFLAATTYVFTTILAVVLGGIAAGSALVKPLLRRDRDWLITLAVLELLIPLAAVGSLAAQSWTYAAGWRTGAVLQGSALSVLPTMLLMGAAFPIGLHCWTAARDERRDRTGERVGIFYLANLTGSIVGAMAAGFLLIPALGVRGASIAIASAELAGGLIVLAVAGRSRPWAASTGGMAVALFAALSYAAPEPLDAVLARRYPGERVLWRHDGAQSTVTVQERDTGVRVMYLDGLHQANDSRPMVAMHRLIGAMAMMLHPNPERALVIGLGGGVTPGAVSLFRRSRIDVVELSPGVVAASDWFRHVNNDVLRQPHVRLRVDDGRNHLLLTRARYDVITADIIQPFHAGAGNLYSREYYELAARALHDDGLMLQWIGHRPRSQYQLIARTFQSVFPHTTVWCYGTLLAGTRRPLQLSMAAYRQRLTDPDFGRALAWAGLAGFRGLVGQYTAGPEELRAFIGDGPVLTDNRPLVEYFRSLPQNERDVDVRGLRGDVERHIVP